MKTSTISELLTGLGGHLGMPGLQPDASGCCQLLFDQQWLVTVVLQGVLGRVALHCPISNAQAVQTLGAAALRAMLEANFMGRGTGRCQLAICTEGRACLVVELALFETDVNALVQALELLLNQAQTWTEWTERAANAPASFARISSPSSPPLAHPVSADLPPFVSFSNPGTAHQRDWSSQRV